MDLAGEMRETKRRKKKRKPAQAVFEERVLFGFLLGWGEGQT